MIEILKLKNLRRGYVQKEWRRIGLCEEFLEILTREACEREECLAFEIRSDRNTLEHCRFAVILYPRLHGISSAGYYSQICSLDKIALMCEECEK